MAEPKRVAAMPGRRARAVVRNIVSHHFGSEPGHIARQTGGLSNLVFSVEHQGAEYIVRLNPKRAKLNPFLKEQWVTGRARDHGVPAPEVLKVGDEPLPYMILRKIPGEPATSHPERMRIVRDLGSFAALINSIPTCGYGTTFDWSSSCSNWKEFLEKEYDLDGRLRALVWWRMLSEKTADRVRVILRGMGRQHRKPVLNHGDLRLKNILVNDKGRITAILDWEMCTSNLAPEWELSTALHDLSIDEKEAFLDGYGLSGRDLPAVAPAVKAFNIVNYSSAIESNVKDRGTGQLERYRIRLSGLLDLYCL